LQSEANISPTKGSLRAEVALPATEFRHKRKLDFILQKESKWRLHFMEDILFVPIEVKTGQNESKGPIKLLNSALDQILATMAKSCYVGYSFSQYGVPSHATAVIMNMAVVEVVHLRYVGVGTPEAKLELYRSGYLPLMTCDIFDKWTGCVVTKYRAEYETIRNTLYGNGGQGGVTDGIPDGLTTLLKLMTQRGKDLYGISVDMVGDMLSSDVLGFGATSVVFRGKENGSECAIKAPRYGDASEIQNEIMILKDLTRNGMHPNIPTLSPRHGSTESNCNEVPKIKVTIGGVRMSLPAVSTCPVGIDPVLILSRKDADVANIINVMRQGVIAALQFMHEKQYCHCDISPRNIVWVNSDVGEQKAVLIDFATTRKSTDTHSFDGTPNYVHRHLFECFLQNRKKHKPEPSHDFAALGFTLAYFANGCQRSWSVGRYPLCKMSVSKDDEDCLKRTMDSRLDAAKKALAEYPDVLELLKHEDSTTDGTN
jgi:hypothetical protein